MKVFGIILLIIGALTTFGGIGDWSVYQIAIGAVMTTFGVQIYNKHKAAELTSSKQNTAPKGKFELNDEMIIRLARKLNNRLSVEDLIQQTSLTREQAKQRLEKLHQQGSCQIDLDSVQESGKIYYNF